MLNKIINSQAPVSTHVYLLPTKRNQKQPHEAVVSPVKRHHDQQDPSDF